MTNLVLCHIIKLFAANNLVLNLDKTNIMKFVTKYSSHSMLHIGYTEKYIEETVNKNFLGVNSNQLMHIFIKKHIKII